MTVKEESEKAGLKLNNKKLRSWHPIPTPQVNRRGKIGRSDRFHFGEAPKSLQMVTAAMKLKDAYSLEGKL